MAQWRVSHQRIRPPADGRGTRVSIAFRQKVGETDPLRTGTYSKALTFTLSTMTPQAAAPLPPFRGGGGYRYR